MKPCLSILAMLVISFNAAYAQVTPVQVTFGDKHDCDPAVSPDGKHLAFASDRTGNYDIYGSSGFCVLDDIFQPTSLYRVSCKA